MNDSDSVDTRKEDKAIYPRSASACILCTLHSQPPLSIAAHGVYISVLPSSQPFSADSPLSQFYFHVMIFNTFLWCVCIELNVYNETGV